MWVQPLGQEALLEEGLATHSRILAWRVPWTEEPGGPQSMGLQSRTRLEESTPQGMPGLWSTVRPSSEDSGFGVGVVPLYSRTLLGRAAGGGGAALRSPGADSDRGGQIWNQTRMSGGSHPGQPSLPRSRSPAADPDTGLLQLSEVCLRGLREVLAASQGVGPRPAPRGWGWVLGYVTGRRGGPCSPLRRALLTSQPHFPGGKTEALSAEGVCPFPPEMRLAESRALPLRGLLPPWVSRSQVPCDLTSSNAPFAIS